MKECCQNGESEQCLKKVAGQMLHQRAEYDPCAISPLKKILTLRVFFLIGRQALVKIVLQETSNVALVS